MTIDSIKYKLRARVGIPPSGERLIYAGKQLEDGFTLGYYNFLPRADIYLVFIGHHSS